LLADQFSHKPEWVRKDMRQQKPCWLLRGAALVATVLVGLCLNALLATAEEPKPTSVGSGHSLAVQHNKQQAKPFRFGKEPLRRRKNFIDLSDEEVKLLCDAIGCMRDGAGHLKPPSPLSIHDPLQWDNYVALHARHCSETAEGDQQVHWSWHFLPWHRAYLFFLERHLALRIKTVLKKDREADQFALPYWDWTTLQAIPNTRIRIARKQASPFFGLDLSSDFDPSPTGSGDPNPFNLALWSGYRGPMPARPDMKPENEDTPGWQKYTREIQTYHANPINIETMLLNPNFCAFGGWPVTSRQSGMGLLESSPHNSIHDWVGSRYGNNRDMGTLRYAALDPLFYLHHANVDRIWSLYQHTPQPGPEPPAPNECAYTPEMLKAWFEKRWEFIDANGDLVYVTVADTIKNMGNITYQHDDRTNKLLARLQARPALQEQSAVIGAEAIKSANKPANFAVPAEKTVAKDQADVRSGDTVASFLEIEVGEYHYVGRFQVRVYAAQGVAGTKVALDDEHFIGSFTVMDSHAGPNKSSAGDRHIFYVNVSSGLSNFYKVAPPGKPFVLSLVANGTGSGQREFFLTLKKETLKVYK